MKICLDFFPEHCNNPTESEGHTMAITVDVARASEKWKRKAGSSQQDYEDGVRLTTNDWGTKTSAASTSYVAGVQAAIGAKRWEAGVAKAGTAGWREPTLAKGPARWAQGIQLSGDKYAQGFAPYAQVISSTTLPPRGPRGAAVNYQRSQALGQALNIRRTGAASR